MWGRAISSVCHGKGSGFGILPRVYCLRLLHLLGCLWLVETSYKQSTYIALALANPQMLARRYKLWRMEWPMQSIDTLCALTTPSTTACRRWTTQPMAPPNPPRPKTPFLHPSLSNNPLRVFTYISALRSP